MFFIRFVVLLLPILVVLVAHPTYSLQVFDSPPEEAIEEKVYVPQPGREGKESETMEIPETGLPEKGSWANQYVVPGIRSVKSSFSVQGNNRFYFNDISGNKEQSFLSPGANYELNYYISQRNSINDGLYNLDYEMNLLNTDDETIDYRKWHITDLYTRFERKDAFLIEFGDIYSNLSTYTLNYNLEGLQGTGKIKYGDNNYLGSTIVAGRTWRGTEGNRYERKVIGTRTYTTVGDKFEAGLNMSRNWDDTGSIKDRNTSIYELPASKNNVYSMDASLKNLNYGLLNGVYVNSELARSMFYENKRDKSTGKKTDWAYRSDFSGQIKKMFFEGGYERVQPNFYSNLGSAPTDQEMVRFNANYRLWSIARVLAGYMWYKTGLQNSDTIRQQNYVPRVSLLMYSIPGIENLEWEFEYRQSRLKRSDKQSDGIRNIYNTNWNYYLNKANIGFFVEHENAYDCDHYHSDLICFGPSCGIRRIKLMPKMFLSTNHSYSINKESYENSGGKDYYYSLNSNCKIDIYEKYYFQNDVFWNKNDVSYTNSNSSRTGYSLELGYTPRMFSKIDAVFKIRFLNTINRYDDSSLDYEEKTLELTGNFIY